MNKKFRRIVSGVLSVMFVGQVMIYGDGSSQGIAHAETIGAIKESLQLSKNADELQKEFENAVDDLGEIDYFASPESGIMMMSEDEISTNANFAGNLTITGNVVTEGNENTPIYVRIFNGDWVEIASKKVADSGGGNFTVSAGGSDVYHIKFECDGYLPFYLKDFGTGKYQVGSGDSWDTVTLVQDCIQNYERSRTYPQAAQTYCITKADTAVQDRENLIKRDFNAQKPLKKLLIDITEVQCSDGKLYVSPVLDCFNGEIIALEMRDNMKKELCIDTIKQLREKYGRLDGTILHSDRGCQYLPPFPCISMACPDPQRNCSLL